MKLIQLVILLGVSVIMGSQLSAQSSLEGQGSAEVSQSVFDTLSKELKYETERRLLPKKRKTRKPETREPAPRSSGFGLAGGFIQGIGYLLIAGLALLILYFLITGIKRKTNIDTSEIELSQIENIEEIDADIGYDEAVKNGNYRLALRMQFIKVLQVLSANQLILWKPDKTNRQYLQETKGQEIHATFRTLSQSYEWVWYGNSAIDKETFDQLNVQFESFNKLDKVT